MIDTILYIAFAVSAGFFLYNSIKIFLLWQRIHAARNWPQVAGQVVRADPGSRWAGFGIRDYYLEIVYSYTVLGTDFTGKSETFSGPQHLAEEKAVQVTAGMPVIVRYDPDKPQNCVTKYDRINRLEVFQLVLSLITILACVAVVLIFIT